MGTTTKPMTDLEIAKRATLHRIEEIAQRANIPEEAVEPYGRFKGKVNTTMLTDRPERGKVVLVTAINPTPAGEGKSTVTVGLADALQRLGKQSIVALREPSLGPVLGLKGGATGGGYAQVLPMEEINLHFTGDLHAITTANNALAAMIDNSIHRGNPLDLDPRRITWRRALDMNDRALRNVTIGLGGVKQGVPREDHFDITVASELMAIFCLATDLSDLEDRISRIVVGYTYDDRPVTVSDLGAQGALTLLLKEAFQPNLVQTMEGTPALIHGGPFANIAHGCNSLIATKTARQLADIVVTEAGFGADLGAEKFMNIKARAGGFAPDAVVVVATIRALKMHGGVSKEALSMSDPEAVERGIANLEKHMETIRSFGVEPIVALNRFVTDTEEEQDVVQRWAATHDVKVALTEVWEKGGNGGLELAQHVIDELERPTSFRPLYDTETTIARKIETIVQQVYGGEGVTFTKMAREQMKEIENNGWDHLPICMAKTQYSVSDDPKAFGRPEGFTITVREVVPKVGAHFLVCLTGDIMTMPGLPAHPQALEMGVDEEGNPVGLM